MAWTLLSSGARLKRFCKTETGLENPDGGRKHAVFDTIYKSLILDKEVESVIANIVGCRWYKPRFQLPRSNTHKKGQ
jgi:hypothetical protein